MCSYRDFGCNETRTRREGIDRHSKTCRFAKQFKKYIDQKHEVVYLRDEVVRLRSTRGRPNIELVAVDIRDFKKLFVESEGLRDIFLKLLANHKPNGVEALIRLFLAKSPRFWKILPDRKHIEVKGWLGGIRTHGEIHEYPLSEVAAEIFSYIAGIIDGNLNRLGFADDASAKFGLERYGTMEGCVGARSFLINSFKIEAERRMVCGPVTYHSVHVQI